jgi:hypothetical protein
MSGRASLLAWSLLSGLGRGSAEYARKESANSNESFVFSRASVGNQCLGWKIKSLGHVFAANGFKKL